MILSIWKIICKNILEKTLQAAKSENDNNLASLNSGYLKNRMSELKSAFDGLNLDPESKQLVMAIIDNELIEITKKTHKFETPIVDLTYNQIDIIRSNTISKEEEYIFINRLQEREKLTIELSKIEKELSHFSDESTVDFESQLQSINSKIDENDKLILSITTLINSKNDEISTLNQEIYQEERSLILSTRDNMVISVIDDMIKSIDIRMGIQLTNCVQELESDINYMYGILKNKKDMVKYIHLQPDYSLKLSGFDDTTVSVQFISEGEKGILMYSVMYGLLNISKSKLPLIIDSPLGRMDSEHVNNLIKHLYPVFGNQVIILSHDREITASSLPLLNSVLSKTFLLKNDYPKVNSGYFE